MDEKINVARDAVVKVFCVHSEPDYSQPWQRKKAYTTTSSGFIISGRKVLTNAHCVKYYTQVEVRKHGSDVKYLAKVLAIGNECGLAMLTVEDDEFWEDVSPVEFASLPVSVVGGDTNSITSGVVIHFIKDYEKNGKYTGFPTLGFTWKTMENADHRMSIGMSSKQTGVLVKTIAPTSPAFHVLKPSDVILSFDGIDIENDGTVLFKHGERIGFSDLVSQKYTGDVAIVKVMRDLKIIEVSIKLAARVPLVPVDIGAPSYYILAGFVFTVVSIPYIDSEEDSMEENIYHRLMDKCLNGMPQSEDEQLVVISQVLEADINNGCEGITNLQVLAFNGNPVRNLKSLAMMVDKCDDEYLRFKLDCGESVVIRTETAKKESEDILSTYAIPSAMSSDLKT